MLPGGAATASIVITRDQHGRFIRQAIDSALAQTGPRVEVIVVADGSTDESRHIIESSRDAVRAVFREHRGQAQATLDALLPVPEEYARLSQADGRLTVSDRYLSVLAALVDRGLHETEVDGGLWTRPRSLARTIAERYGPDPVGPCDLIQGQPDEYARLRDRLLRRVGIKTRMVRDILQEGEWDLVLAGFAETHCAGHQLWRLHADAEELAPDAPRIAPADAMRDVYVAADRALGELLEIAGRDTVCLVLASHGFGPSRGNKILDDILGCVDGAGSWHHVQALMLRREYADRRFFAVPNNDIYGAIRFNLVGREPRGRVRPEDVERVRDELERELRSVIDLDTGEPAVARVVTASEYYDRQPRDGLPDLFVQWTGARPIVRVRTGRGDVVEGYYPDYRTGDHRDDDGVWITGPGLTGQALASPISIMHSAPTIGALLNVALLPGLDGRPIPGVAAADVPSRT